jgi:LasA protease
VFHRRRAAGFLTAVLAPASAGLAIPGTAQAAPRSTVTEAVTDRLLGQAALAGRSATADRTLVPNVSCGGSASGRHVQFGLRQDNGYVPIADHGLGGWVFYATGWYQGYAMHGSTLRNSGSTLHNYGAMGLDQGVVDANGGGSVNKRSGPGTGYAVVGSVADGAFVTVSCSRNGTTHEGRFGTASLWNRLSDGTWISDAYLWTGYNGAVNGTC